MKTLFAIAALAAVSLATAQKTRELKAFKNLTVGADMNVTLVKSGQYKLVIEGGDDEALEVGNEGGSLALKGDGNKVTVYYVDAIENIVAGADAVVNGKDTLKTGTLSITASSDARVDLTIDVRTLNTAANANAQITLSGKAGQHAATYASDAKLNAKGLDTRDTAIVLASDASAEIYATGNVTATVAADGSLKIHGNPKKVDQVKGDDAKIVVVK